MDIVIVTTANDEEAPWIVINLYVTAHYLKEANYEATSMAAKEQKKQQYAVREYTRCNVRSTFCIS